jgi:hypothetical protein
MIHPSLLTAVRYMYRYDMMRCLPATSGSEATLGCGGLVTRCHSLIIQTPTTLPTAPTVRPSLVPTTLPTVPPTNRPSQVRPSG